MSYKMNKFLAVFAKIFGITLMATGIILPPATLLSAQDNNISLAGEWDVKLDRNDAGIREQWYSNVLTDATPIQLPGSIQEYDLGDKVSSETDWTASSFQDIDRLNFFNEERYQPYTSDDNFKWPYWLTSDTYYKGVAWYKREVSIPEKWKDKRITLNLERAHWGTMVFVDDQRVGADSSLSVPHRYNLSSQLSPGDHTIAVRVDNRLLYGVGINAHSVTDHTQTNWNGLVGDLNLTASSPVYISDVKIYPDVENKQATVKVRVKNSAGGDQSGTIRLQASSTNAEKSQELPAKTTDFNTADTSAVEIIYPMGDDPLLWDEFNPQFYTMDVSITGEQTEDEQFEGGQSEAGHAQAGQSRAQPSADSQTEGKQTENKKPEDEQEVLDTQEVDFGMREFKVQGTRFAINGKPIFLRGTLMSAIFPKTGYPSTSKKEWARHFDVIKQHGLNHARFHSWCPPEAAFEAADEAGIYLQVEAPLWANEGSTIGDGKPIDQYLIDESKRIMDEYGNHPSFVMFAHGNEPAGDNQEAFLGEFVSNWKQKDDRRVYTSGSGWPAIPENDYHDLPAPRIQGWGEGLKSIINAEPPSTDWNFTGDIKKFDKPVVGHEIGQWVVYPNFNEMSKYSGVLYPHNFEIFKDFLENNHMGHQAHDFLMASGELQVLCYKADIEAALRTPGYSGYQMLDLHDFPGQGTALVGILDPFWDSKPYINPAEFRRFSSRTVPLAVMKKRVLSNNETFTADLEIAHFAEKEVKDVPVQWRISGRDGKTLAKGGNSTDLPIGNNIKAGAATLDLSSFEEPQKLNLEVRAGNLGENDWDFWVYPEKVETRKPSDLIVTNTLRPEIEQKLKDGADVLLKLNGKLNERSGKNVMASFSTIFWNTAWTGNQPPHAMGVLVEPSDPLFDSFTTEYHSNWQWWDIVHDVRPMILTGFPAELTPSIQMIDTWFKARKLGLLFEAKVGEGNLMVTSIDFDHDLDNRLAARQLYSSIMEYVEGDDFDPQTTVDLKLVKGLYE